MPAYLIVRARVPDPADRPRFDRWYQDEHLAEARTAFAARSAWRGWSEVDPETHYAFYEFDSVADARSVLGSSALEGLTDEFDRTWNGRATRVRDVVESIQGIGPG